MLQNDAGDYQEQFWINSSLIYALNVIDPSFSSQDLEMLGETRDKRIIKLLLEMLKDENSVVRLASIRALREVKSRRFVKPLISMLGDSSSAVRLEAINSLGEIRDKRVLRPLISCLSDEVSENREAAAIALGMMPDPGSIGPLANASKDTYSWVRAAAVSSLGKIHSKNCVEPLIQCLNDISYVVQVTAAESLGMAKGRIVVQSLIEGLRGDGGYRGKKGEGDPEQLRRLELLYNRIDELGEKPSWGMSLIPDNASFSSLMENAERGNHLMRRACAESLGMIKSRSAVKPLTKALGDPNLEVSEAAAWALGSIKRGRKS